MLALCIRGLAAPTSLDANEADTIASVRERIATLHSVTAHRLLLSFRGTPLEDDGATLSAVGVHLDPVLHVADFTELCPQDGRCNECYRISETPERGVTLHQLCNLLTFLGKRCGPDQIIDGWSDIGRNSPQFGQVLCYNTFNLYHAVDWIIRPATKTLLCSYVELVTVEAKLQRPQWFVSHAWSEPVARFVHCLEGHVDTRGLSRDTPFWVCAYANNQHELGQDLTRDPCRTSFFRAMRLCIGLLLVLDEHARPFSRIWCCFEMSMALTDQGRDERMLFDIATVSEGSVHVLTDGLTAREAQAEESVCSGAGQKAKGEREANFPVELIAQALDISIEQAQSSEDIDRIRILNSIAGLKEEGLDESLPELPDATRRAKYDRINHSLRALFAVASWRQVLQKGAAALYPRILRAVQADAAMESLSLCLSGLGLKCQDAHLIELGQSLPCGLRTLRIECRGCSQLSSAGLTGLARSLQRATGLRLLFLDFFACGKMSDSGAAGLGESLQSFHQLEELHLNFRGCARLTNAGATSITRMLKCFPALRKLHLNLIDLKKLTDDSIAGVDGLAAGLLHLSGLVTLKLYCKGCNKISDLALGSVGESLGQLIQLREIRLDLSRCIQLTDAGVARLADNLCHLASLEGLSLHMQGCRCLSSRSVVHLGSALQSLRQLRSLNLNLSSGGDLGDSACWRGTAQFLDHFRTLVQRDAFDLVVRILRGPDPEGAGTVQCARLLHFLRAIDPDGEDEVWMEMFHAAGALQSGGVSYRKFIRWLLEPA